MRRVPDENLVLYTGDGWDERERVGVHHTYSNDYAGGLFELSGDEPPWPAHGRPHQLYYEDRDMGDET